MTIKKTKDCIEDLSSHFGFDEFRDCEGHGIIQDLMDEISHYIAEVCHTEDFFWSSVDGVAEYDVSLVRKIVMYLEKYSGHTWQGHCIERFCRVEEWWRIKAPSYNYFLIAARCVALDPVSSVSVEQIFSQAKMIIATIDQHCLEETIETRLMERVNRY